MITIATDRDMNRAVGLAAGFAGKDVDENAFIDWWAKMIRAGVATVFYRQSADQKVRESIGVLVFQSPLNAKKQAGISFWYFDVQEPPSLVKGILFIRMLEFLKEQGVTDLYCNVNLDGRVHVVSAFLLGNGFEKNEIQFKKKLI